MKNIILIGMPGAGKSTIGVVLAKTLNMRFVDTDLLIQDREKRLLQDIIRTEGIGGFKEIEESVLLSLDCTGTVVATGGSCVYSDRAINHLKCNGTIIYLSVSIEEIIRRIKNIKTRGIVCDESQDLSEIYEERTPLYEKYADIMIDCNNKNIEEIIEIISNMPQ